MKDKSGLIQNYVNNFRRRITHFLRPGIGLSCKIYPTETEGAIIEFTMGPELKNDDLYLSNYSSLGDALSQIKQKAFGGHLGGFRFSGTNLILEENRIILIKDYSPQEWDDSATEQDISRVLSKPQGDPK